MNNNSSIIFSIFYTLLMFIAEICHYPCYSFDSCIARGNFVGESDKKFFYYSRAINLWDKKDTKEKLAETYYMRARYYFYKKFYGNSISDFTKAIKINPKDIYYSERGRIYERIVFLKDVNKNYFYHKAIADYTKAIKLNPKRAGLYYRERCKVYTELKLFAKAKQDYESVEKIYEAELTNKIKSNLNDAFPYRMRGTFYYDKELYNKAIIDYNKVIELSPLVDKSESYYAYYNRANIYIEKNEYDNAIKDYNALIKLNPNDELAYTNRGVSYHRKKMYDQALLDYKKALKIDSKDYLVYHNIGCVYNKKKMYQQALLNLNKAINLNPEYLDSYYLRGNIYMKTGLYKDALNNYAHIINTIIEDENIFKKSENDYFSCWNSSWDNSNNSNIKEKKELLADTYNNTGFLYFDLKKYNDAIKYFKKTLEIDSKHNIYDGLAIIYYKMGNKKKAIELYKKAIKFDKRYAGKINELINDDDAFFTQPQLQTIKTILNEMKIKSDI